jgi:hypothetical protein
MNRKQAYLPGFLILNLIEKTAPAVFFVLSIVDMLQPCLVRCAFFRTA